MIKGQKAFSKIVLWIESIVSFVPLEDDKLESNNSGKKTIKPIGNKKKQDKSNSNGNHQRVLELKIFINVMTRN
jgi:hypothetical protein